MKKSNTKEEKTDKGLVSRNKSKLRPQTPVTDVAQGAVAIWLSTVL